MLLAIASHRGSPGVTTTALAVTRVAAARGFDAILVEADADGGAVRHLLPDLDPDRNLLSYAVASRRDPSFATLDAQAQPLEPGAAARTLLAPAAGPQVARALDMCAEPLAESARHPDRLVVVDCGRVSGPGARLFDVADMRWLLVTPRHDLVLSLRDLLTTCPYPALVDVLTVGDKPYGPDDLHDIGVPVRGVVGFDPKTADVVRGHGEMSEKRFGKSDLIQSIAGLIPPAPTRAHDADGDAAHAITLDTGDATTAEPDDDAVAADAQ